MSTTTIQPALPGVLVPAHAVTAAAAEICGHVVHPCATCIHRASTALAAGLAAIDPSFALDQHMLVIAGDPWTLQHPLSCRPHLTRCPVHTEIATLDADSLLDIGPGTHTVTDVDGRLLIGGLDPYDGEADDYADHDD